MKNTIGSEVKRKKRTKVLAAISVALMVCTAACGLHPGALPKGEDRSKIMVSAGDAVTGEGLSNVSVIFIPGRDNPAGDAVCQAVSGDVEGTGVELPCGEYTVQWSADGYHTGYQNMEVREEETLVRKWMMPVFEGDAAYILMEWESETDLDLCVYNEQTGRCLGRETTLEDAGSFSYGDDDGTKGCELVFLNDYDKNTYMIYVKDNERTAEDQRTADDQGTGSDTAGITVSVYTSEGLIYRKRPDEEKRAALWNCACINHGRVEEQDEYIYDLTEYAWAARSKENPALWLEDASAKAEEIYRYASDNRLIKIEKNIFGMNGKVIPVLVYRYDDDGNYSITYNDDEYDERGNLLASYGHNSDGNIVCYEQYEYDEAGNRLVGYLYNDDGSLYGYQKSEYDEAGNRLVLYYTFGHFNYKYEYTYDTNGNITACWRYNSEGVLTGSEEYQYDLNGNCISCYKYDEQGLMKNVSRLNEYYKYDENGNLAAVYTYDGNGLLIYRTEYKYSEDGRRKERCKYENDILTYQYVEIFDAKGNKIAEYIYDYGKLTITRIWEYNENGDCTRMYDNHHGGRWYKDDRIEEYIYEYEYDAVGGMKIQYWYEDSILIWKTITLFY